MKTIYSAALPLFLLCFGSPSFAADSNWPQWRGPDGSGTAATDAVVTQWGPNQNVKWRIELPEPGNTDRVGGPRVFHSAAVGLETTQFVLC